MVITYQVPAHSTMISITTRVLIMATQRIKLEGALRKSVREGSSNVIDVIKLTYHTQHSTLTTRSSTLEERNLTYLHRQGEVEEDPERMYSLNSNHLEADRPNIR